MSGFFSREAGQKRRAWLDGLLSDYIGEPARYFLGPTGIPQKAAQAAGLLDFTDAGDMVAAADASRELWNNPSIGSAANYAAAGAAMALPFYSARMGQGVADLADDARRFVADESGTLNLDLLRSKYPGAQIDVTGNPSRGYTVNRIVVPEGARETGTGTAIMKDIMRQADIDGATVSLTPSGDFGGNVSRLRRFYEGLGFTPNKGRNRDFGISEEMYRLPQPGDPATTRAQSILDMLAEGRASEITDDMLDLGDPVLNARLNMYLFENYDLPMDEASRMARAREMGFDTDTPLYHGTDRPVDGFDPKQAGRITEAHSAKAGTWATTSPRTAESYADFAANSVPVRDAINRAYAAEDAGKWDDYDRLMREAKALEREISANPGRGQNIIPLQAKYASPTREHMGVYPSHMDAEGQNWGAVEGRVRGALEDAKDYGMRGFDIDNLSDVAEYGVHDPAFHTIRFRPESYRSRFARFDPRLAHLRNLSAGVGALTVGNALTQDDENEIRDYLGLLN